MSLEKGRSQQCASTVSALILASKLLLRVPFLSSLDDGLQQISLSSPELFLVKASEPMTSSIKLTLPIITTVEIRGGDSGENTSKSVK